MAAERRGLPRVLGVRNLRTGLSWADSLRPGALDWFDRQMRALEEFSVTVTLCFTPESRGVKPHHTSVPRDIAEYADFRARMTRRFAAAESATAPLALSRAVGMKVAT